MVIVPRAEAQFPRIYLAILLSGVEYHYCSFSILQRDVTFKLKFRFQNKPSKAG